MKSPITNPSFAKTRCVLNIPRRLTALLVKGSPRMQELVITLAKQNGYDLNDSQAPLRLESGSQGRDAIPLVIERRGAHLIAVAQMVQADAEGTAWQMLPEVVFFTGNGKWVPVSFQGSPTSYQQLSTLRQQRKTAAFAEEWAAELGEQTWLRSE